MTNKKTTIKAVTLSIILILVSVLSLFLLEQLSPEFFGSITGKLITQVYVIPAYPMDCNVTMYNGQNLLSFFCIPNYFEREQFLANFTGYTKIYAYRAGNSDPWKSYKTNMPGWVVQDLDYFSRTDGYWFFMNISNTINYFYNGSKVSKTTLYLKEGWNLIGYPTNIPQNTSFFLNQTEYAYEIRSYDNENKTYKSYVKNSGGTLILIESNYGYWLYVNQSTSLEVNW
ncbi:MAG: hypothetical protein KKB65_01295 [Nanoarchaeota archaeon]|nr:hypothetical protein [Nanoarchaeota archaeon]MBU1029844.1 hypothetical protein [Nanoarchaeota archaeon]MBU1849430.1 hypothetical protein [Nanoarchaeota archaeon]